MNSKTVTLEAVEHLDWARVLMAQAPNHAGQPSGKLVNGDSGRWCDQQDLQNQLPNPTFSELAPQLSGRQPQHLELFVLDALARSAALPIEEAELEMQAALKRVCEVSRLKFAGIWRNSLGNLDSLELAYHLPGCALEECPSTETAGGGPQPALRKNPGGTRFKIPHGWTMQELQRRKAMVYCGTVNSAFESDQDNAAPWSLGERSGVIIPLFTEEGVVGAVSFGTDTEEKPWPGQLVRSLQALAGIFAHLAARKRSEERLRISEAHLKQAGAQIEQLNERFQAEGEPLRVELEFAHEGIIGQAKRIKQVLRQVEQVAPADCSVLITGETGTGKELVAQEIHRLSKRKDRDMVLINCAAIPSQLVESELFGRERGAYTGAQTSQAGRFEMADGSTVFLDEVGEFPLELQAKLLRVLQQGEFQRLGSPKTHNVDVRVIAATNRDLAEAVRKGKFREDLYYRLRVFPIEMPPLRERSEDIPALVFAFMQEFSRRLGKKLPTISRKDLETLQGYAWPGNIRELRNVVERSVIVSSGPTLNLTLSC